MTYSGSTSTGKGKGKRREGRRKRSPTSSSSGEYWKPPPSKSRRPEGFPEAGTGNSGSQPPPPEDDASGVGWDDSGMAPEVSDIILAEEYEDLNVHPVTMDRTSDSPEPTSPNQAAALEKTLMVTIGNDGPDEDSVGFEMVIPSTQPDEFEQETLVPEPTPGPSADTRKVKRRAKDQKAGSAIMDLGKPSKIRPTVSSRQNIPAV